MAATNRSRKSTAAISPMPVSVRCSSTAAKPNSTAIVALPPIRVTSRKDISSPPTPGRRSSGRMVSR
jgi:hypothetical protein